MTKDLFVTGTDTGVGKTLLSALLVAALRRKYWKPIQTGACDGTDRQAVMNWAGVHAERGIIRSKHQRNNVGVAAAGLEAAGSQALTEVPAEFDKPVPLRICLRGQA